MTDYDGTLVPLSADIRLSRLDAGGRSLLRVLALRHRLCLVTGRDLGDLRRLAGPLAGAVLVGTHGAEASGLAGFSLSTPGHRKRLERDRSRLVPAMRGEFSDRPHSILQVKRYALSLHDRGLNGGGPGEASLRRRFRAVASRVGTRGLWSIQDGKGMIDLRPRGFSKALAARALMRRFPGLVPVFAGDDLSDLPALRAVGRRGVRVGIGGVVARKDCDRWFPHPAAFRRWLKSLS